jgi:hypothetical protein
MKGIALLTGALSAVLAGVSLGCTEQVGPVAPPRAATVPASASAPTLVRVPVVPRAATLAAPVSATQVIDAGGGTIVLAALGLRVVVPAGALGEPTAITVTAPAGADAAYLFEPHGLHFAQPVILSQELRALGAAASGGATLYGAYFPDATDLLGGGEALAAETYPVTVDTKSRSLRFAVWHFSGYMVSSGGTGKR